MLSFVNLVSDDIKIEENFEKLLQRKCDTHNKYKASYCCINLLCVKNSCCFLCELCYSNHPQSHLNNKEIKTVDQIFSTKRFTQMKDDCKIDPSFQDIINKVLQDIDNMFETLKITLCDIIDKECKKVKAHIQQKFSLDNEYIMEIFKEHEKVLIDVFTKDEIIDNFNLMISPYLESFTRISETFKCQIEMVENNDKNIALLLNNFSKIKQEHKDLADIVQQKIKNFDQSYFNINSIQLDKSNETLLQKLKAGIVGKIDKKIPKCILVI